MSTFSPWLPGWLVAVPLAAVLAGCTRTESPAQSKTSASTAPVSRNPQATGGAHPLLGVWEFEAGRYGDEKEFTPANPALGKLKFIGESNFVWFEYDRQTGRIQTGAGGRCHVNGTNLTETIEFFGPGMDQLLGQTLTFSEQLEGERLRHRGQLPDGFAIEETWKRATVPGPAP